VIAMAEEKENKEKRTDLTVREGETAPPTVFRPFEWVTDIDRWFDDFRRGFDELFYRPHRIMEMPLLRVPAMDVIEHEDHYEITAELPGLDKEDVDIQIQKDTLEIKAEKKEEKEIKRKGYMRRERGRRTFYRKLALPEDTVSEKIEASLDKGILTLTLPKKEPEPAKKVEIK
jgi:HSP20 family protein